MINSLNRCATRHFFFLLPQPAAPVTPVVTAPQQPAAAPPQPSSGGSLDSMLGLLQSDLSRQGVQTSSKGNCSACQKPVVGQVSCQLKSTCWYRQVDVKKTSNWLLTVSSSRWWRLWGRCGTRSTLCALSVRRSWAVATSLRRTDDRTASRTTSPSSPLTVHTATSPY